MDFLCSNLVKTIFTYWIGTVFNLILQLAALYLLLFNLTKRTRFRESFYLILIFIY